MRKFLLALPLAVLPLGALAVPLKPALAELTFGPQSEKPGALQGGVVPEWVTKVEQQGGHYLKKPACWEVKASEPTGTGRISISVDRTRINEDLVATILFEGSDTADLAVQLFDAQGRVVEVDLFGNLVEVGAEARTNTFIIPLRKFPSAEKIVLRRVSGDVKVYGMVLYPAVTEGAPNPEALQKLANVLGDPLSPENPLLKGLQQIARAGSVAIAPPATQKAAGEAPAPAARGKYPGAVPPAAGAVVPPVPGAGLAGYWNFDQSNAQDSSGREHHGKMLGGAAYLPGLRGQALRLRKNPSSSRAKSWDSVSLPPTPELDFKESFTVSAWVKYSSIAPTWGSQIAWFGDSEFGCDPWQLHLLSDGTLEFRSDRSVTGAPVFTVFEDEIRLSPKGRPMLTQHVGVWSPDTLAPETWYFVAGSVEKLSPQSSALSLFVNGALVGRVKTAEAVQYPTEKMWMTIGGVDKGTWQNFDGWIDEVRVYNRSLSQPELKALYSQPWR